MLPCQGDLSAGARAATVAISPEDSCPAIDTRKFEVHTQRAENYLAARRGEFREKGIGAESHVVYGPLVESIIRAAERQETDRIAPACDGRRGL